MRSMRSICGDCMQSLHTGVCMQSVHVSTARWWAKRRETHMLWYVFSVWNTKAVCVWAGRDRNVAELILRSTTFLLKLHIQFSQTAYLNGNSAQLSFLPGQLKRKRLYVGCFLVSKTTFQAIQSLKGMVKGRATVRMIDDSAMATTRRPLCVSRSRSRSRYIYFSNAS